MNIFGTPETTLYGFAVFVSPDVPKMQLSERVKEVLSPQCIEETNAWMLRFFGYTNVIKDGEALVMEKLRQVHVNPRMYEALKKAAK